MELSQVIICLLHGLKVSHSFFYKFKLELIEKIFQYKCLTFVVSFIFLFLSFQLLWLRTWLAGFLSFIEKVAIVLYRNILLLIVKRAELLKTLLINLVEGIVNIIDLVELTILLLSSRRLQKLPSTSFFIYLIFILYRILLQLFLLWLLLRNSLFLNWVLNLLKTTWTILIRIWRVTKYRCYLHRCNLDIVVTLFEDSADHTTISMREHFAQVLHLLTIFSCTSFFGAHRGKNPGPILIYVFLFHLVLTRLCLFLGFSKLFVTVL